MINADASKVGPKKILRSEAEDGALTIAFNPETYASSYTGDGFVAEVSEFVSTPLSFKESVVNQVSKDVASVGTADIDIISFNVKAEGDQGELKLNGITLDLKESKNAINKISILSTGDSEEVGSTAKTVATVTEFGANNTLDITFAEPLSLVEGNNWLRVRYDSKMMLQLKANLMQQLLLLILAQQVRILLMEIQKANAF